MTDQAETQSPSIKEQIGQFLAASQEQPQGQSVEAPETPEGEVPAQVQQDPNAQQEAAQAEPQAEWEEVELDGEKLQVPPKWAKAFMQEKDYTQKRQADADYRKTLETREQSINFRERAQAALQPLYQKGQQVDANLQELARVDWATLEATDPLKYLSKRQDQATLIHERDTLIRQVQAAQHQVGMVSQQMLAKAINDAAPVIKRHVPDWGTKESGERFMKFASDVGISQQEMVGIAATPWAVVVLEDARKYRELQAGKAQLPKKVSGLSPVAKPGARTTVQTAAQTSYRNAKDALQKSGGKDKGSIRAMIRAKLGS